MLKDFLDFIKKHALINERDNVLLAVSGGIDSVVMVNLFRAADINFTIAHCNFGLRGDESDADMEFVRGLSRDFGVHFHSENFKTAVFAKEKGISTQMAARELRYEWFGKLCETFGYTKIATAHHQDDNVETLVHNLIRGTSISGLRGILPMTSGIIRPLLFAPRARIEAYAEAEGIAWQEDSSNRTDHYKRNYIRHQILPHFLEINPNYREVMDTSMRKNLEVEDIFKAHLEKVKGELVEEVSETQFKISIQKLLDQSIGPYVLSEVLSPFGFNFDQCTIILDKLSDAVGKCFETREYVLTIDRAYIFIDAIGMGENIEFWIDAETKSLGSPSFMSFQKLSGSREVEKDANKAFLDLDRLNFPLQLRNWAEGDTFVPLGMSGKKKLSDFMIDTKIPLNLKKQQQVILSGGEVVWVVGKRIDDRFKVTGQTENIFLITLDQTHV